jgi:hypothetical protein
LIIIRKCTTGYVKENNPFSPRPQSKVFIGKAKVNRGFVARYFVVLLNRHYIRDRWPNARLARSLPVVRVDDGRRAGIYTKRGVICSVL